MQKVLTAAEMREVDRLTTEKYGIPSLLLMENAAHAAARVITENLGGSVEGKSLLILCGKGNNGGDGAALARILYTQKARVEVVLFGKVADTKGDARINFEICHKRESEPRISETFKDNIASIEYFPFYECNSQEEWDELLLKMLSQDWDCVVDAIFGTGLTRPLNGWLGNVVHHINGHNEMNKIENDSNRLLVSIDLPSGLNADSSEINGAIFQADVTVTFTAPKPANVLPPATRFNGKVITEDIGSSPNLIENSESQLFISDVFDAIQWLEQTKFTPDSHKTKRGRALIVAGSRDMPGAASLAANAAMKSGLGLVRVATPKSAQTVVAARTMAECMVAGVAETENGAISHDALEEVLKLTEKADVVSIGSGLSSDDESTKKFVREFVEKRRFPVVIDADGLNALAPFDLQGSDDFPLILTPHIGEMRRLFGDEAADFSDAVKIAREFAQKHHIILVLKGEKSLIASPDGRVIVNPTGNSALGKAGAGDNLCGIITGFLAQSYGARAENADPFLAVVAALYISGRAGEIAAEKIGKRTMTATDVRECLADAFREFEND